MAVTLFDLLPPGRDASSDDLLDRFLRFVDERGLSLYPAQEEAILALLEGQNVILNTPTGSGKSLVASAMLFAALARGERAVYTCPIKALVNEKWMALCRDFGAEMVGLSTGDASVNRDAPILCCTAEVLSNIALRLGAEADVDHVVMDEFHYYADRDRGVAWQVPLLTMARTRFLLMSATLGDTTPFEGGITRLTGRPTVTVKSVVRPVPLDYAYAEIPLPHTIEKLVDEGRTPAYVVHFTQADAAASAQDFTSLKIATKEQKAEIAARIETVDFSSPYGPSVRKWLKHGIGLHHAGLLPKYRVLVEQLAQRGLLRVICGTDTLGAGINVPIRTVVLTKLCKFDGEKTARLSAREFHQIAGRAGRKGFDDRGYVVAQAPEHVIENLRLAEKASRDGRKVVKRRPPDHNYVDWDLAVFTRLTTAPPEPLVSRFAVSHGTLLNVLSRRGDGCDAMRRLIRDSHDTPAQKAKHRRRSWQLFRALLARGIVGFGGADDGGDAGLRVNVDLQDDFSMDHALSLYLIETIGLLDRESASYALDLLTLVESILENPELILRRQLDRLKGQAVAEMKANGLDYDQRMAELEKLEYPKPLRDFVYDTFNAFAERHPWVEQEAIRPKSIAREMFERYQSFAEYVMEYDLERSEGLLLRHLNSVYKVLSQTVPDDTKSDEVLEIEWYLKTLVRTADASLADEWERMRDPSYEPLAAGRDALARRPERVAAPYDLTADTPAFVAAIRARVFAALKAWASGDGEGAVSVLDAPTDAEASAATPVDLTAAVQAFAAEHGQLRFDPEARNARHTHVDRRDAPAWWRVQQVLVDTADLNDWVAEVDVDVEASRDRQQPVLWLRRIGPIAG